MTATMKQGLLGRLKGLFGSLNDPSSTGDEDFDVSEDVDRLAERTVPLVEVAAQGTAGTAHTTEACFAFEKDAEIVGIKIVPFGALTANNTNYRTCTVEKTAAAVPGTPADVASVTTQITGGGTWVSGTPVPMTVATKNVNAGDVLWYKEVIAASGVATPIHKVQATYRER